MATWLIVLLVATGLGRGALAQAMPELTLAIASPALIYGPVWVALSENLFERNGVKVDVVSTNALTTGSAMIVSGRADLLATTAFLGMRIAMEGKPLSYVFSVSNMGARVNALITRPDIKSLEALAAMGEKCKILTLPTGTATWAIYQGIAAKYNLKCSISTAGTVPLVIAGAMSGQFEGAVVNPQDAYTAREAGRANVLIDPLVIDDTTANEIYPYHHPVSVVFGLRSDLAGKREAVIRFVKALRQADEEIGKMTPEQLGDLSNRMTDVFGSTPLSALVLQWKIQQTLAPRGANAGYISAAEWAGLVDAAPKLWGFANLDPADPSLRYSSTVDMSYFDASQ